MSVQMHIGRSNVVVQTLKKVTIEGLLRNGMKNFSPQVNRVVHLNTSSHRHIARDKNTPRRLFIVRHGERLDFVFGKSWCDQCFDDKGNYLQADLNMPKTLLKRTSNYLDYAKDAPLTSIGNFQALLTGEALKSSDVVLQHVYSSPSLRCIQTVTAILKTMGQDISIRIEPGIFEWMGFYQLELPHWFTPSELKEHGFNIDVHYKPLITMVKYDIEEDIAKYFRRSAETVKHILQKHQQDGGNILIQGHAGSLEACSHSLLGKSHRSSQEFRDLCSKMPYCAVLELQEDAKTKKWTILESPIKTLSHSQNKQQDVKQLVCST